MYKWKINTKEEMLASDNQPINAKEMLAVHIACYHPNGQCSIECQLANEIPTTEQLKKNKKFKSSRF